ncbi:MAG TPA: efflux RND transporter periplasmic adaptor subunit [Candidatus Polarisedimenticolia bacterium]|jgi:HlyD family secretion protein|nr:efflux RND transporter periplasmic adaptor subunit [Candidatus Polarisedimenticolia bacterium]
MRRLLIIGSIAAVAVATLAAIYLERGDKDEDGGYRMMRVDRGTVSETVTATGTISAVTTVQVGSQVSGIISRLHADYNSPVKRGQLLAELDPTPFQAQVEQRTAELAQAEVQKRNAEIAFHRSERLKEEGLEADAEFDAARAAFDSAQAQVDLAAAGLRQAKTSLSYARIFSPIDGVVVARQYDIGQTVAASFQAPTLFTIAEDLTKMRVLVDVDQSDIGRTAVGQTARFTVDAYPEETFSGQISQIRLNATQNQNVVTYPVIVDVANPDRKLRPLMTADVTIEVSSVPDVLRVPNAALRFQPIETERTGGRSTPEAAPAEGTRSGAGLDRAAAALTGTPARDPRQQTVHVVGPHGVLRPVPVRAGLTDGRFTQILEGDLREGDRVAVGLATSKSAGGGSFPGVGQGAARGGRRPF